MLKSFVFHIIVMILGNSLETFFESHNLENIGYGYEEIVVIIATT